MEITKNKFVSKRNKVFTEDKTRCSLLKNMWNSTHVFFQTKRPIVIKFGIDIHLNIRKTYGRNGLFMLLYILFIIERWQFFRFFLIMKVFNFVLLLLTVCYISRPHVIIMYLYYTAAVLNFYYHSTYLI